jgi:hypothetical protein
MDIYGQCITLSEKGSFKCNTNQLFISILLISDGYNSDLGLFKNKNTKKAPIGLIEKAHLAFEAKSARPLGLHALGLSTLLPTLPLSKSKRLNFLFW